MGFLGIRPEIFKGAAMANSEKPPRDSEHSTIDVSVIFHGYFTVIYAFYRLVTEDLQR